MRILKVNEVLKDKVLVSRESARLLEDALRTTMTSTAERADAARATPVIVDFDGVAGVAPSFLDELLSIFESFVGTETLDRKRELILAHPPNRLSSKFQAIARGHGMSVQALPDGSWLLTATEGARA